MILNNSAHVLGAIRGIQEAEKPDEVMRIFTPYVERYGFAHIHLGQLVNPANIAKKDILSISTWPGELMSQRAEKYDLLHDPVALGALRSKRPFRWQKAMEWATRRGQRVIDQTRDFGIRDGYVFPVHSIDSVSGAVSLGGDQLDLSRTELAEVELVSLAAYARLETLLGPFPYQKIEDLTAREAEVIQFAAAGKTNRDIATILSIQPDTVNKTILRAALKLGTLNRAHTVATAIAKNMIFA